MIRPTGCPRLLKWLVAFCVLECVGAATLPTSPAPELEGPGCLSRGNKSAPCSASVSSGGGNAGLPIDTLALHGADLLQRQAHRKTGPWTDTGCNISRLQLDTAFASNNQRAPNKQRAPVRKARWLNEQWLDWQDRRRKGILDSDNPGKTGTKSVVIVLVSYSDAPEPYAPWNYGAVKRYFGGSPEKFAEAVVLHSARVAPIYRHTPIYRLLRVTSPRPCL